MRLDELPPQEALPSLTTARLLLRPMTLTDVADVFAYASDPDVLRYTTGTPPRRIEETETFLRDALAAPNGRVWAIRLHGAPIVIGAIEFGLQSPASASIHYALGRPHWGRGLMTEVVDAICWWAFQTLSMLLEISTTVVDANAGSARVLAKCGFARTGVTVERWAKQEQPVTLLVFRLERPALMQWQSVPVFGQPPTDHAETPRPSAYALIPRSGGQIAVVRTPQALFLPGGGIDPGESVEEAVVREVREECGLDVTIGSWRARAIDHVFASSEQRYFAKRCTFVDAFVAGATGERVDLDHELLWLEPEHAAAQLSHPAQGWAVMRWTAHVGARAAPNCE